MTTATIVELTAEDTWPLRSRVLRDGTPSREIVLDGDDEPTTLHLGAVDADGIVVAVSTWIHRGFPPEPERRAVQLRAMATGPTARGTGLGRRLLVAGMQRCADAGATLVWANARDSALGFYRGHGFEVVGPGFLDEATGVPHHRVARAL